MPRIVLVVSSPRFPLLFPPQTWRALDAARPVYLLDAEHPSLPALDVGEIPWEVLTPAADSGPAGRDLLLVGQGLDLERVAEAGFGWPTRTGPADKVREELEEVLAADEPEQLEWEVGDLLFAAVALARAVGVEPEAALRRTSRRFRARYAAVRAAAEADGHDPSSLELEQWLAYWKAAKRALAEAEEAATGTES